MADIPYRLKLQGQTFGELFVLRKGRNSARGEVHWVCRCSCGAIAEVRGGNLRSGNTVSCGHVGREKRAKAARITNRTHGMTGTPTYLSWSMMKSRCYNEKNNRHQSHGGRGILVCDRWLDSFEAFLEDMGSRPDGMSLDRVDNDGDYQPSNCRWATPQQQNNNRRSNARFEYRGVTYTLAELARMSGVKYDTLKRRLRNYGWTVERAVGPSPYNLQA